MFRSFACTALGLVAVALSSLSAASGTDPAFVASFAGPAAVRSVLPLADGGALVFGDFEQFEGVPRNRVARVGADGAVLALTGASGAQPAPPTQIQEVGDGSALLAGEFVSYDGQPALGLVRVNLATGAVLETFPGPVGGGVYKYFLPGNGYIYRVRADGFASTRPLERLLPNRQPDPAFVCSVYAPRTVFAGPGGTLVVHDTNFGQNDRLRRVLSDGSADVAFPVQSYPSQSIRLGAFPDGRFLLWESGPITMPQRLTRRLAADGAVDPAFAQLEFDVSFLPLQLALAADGSAILSGYSYNPSVNNPLPLGYGTLRASAAGAVTVLARGFASDSTVELRAASAVDGRLWIWGEFSGCNGVAAGGLVRLAANLAPGPERTFRATGTTGSANLFALAPASQAGTFVGGNFLLVGGLPAGHFARLDATGGPLGPVASFDGPIQGLRRGADGRLLVWGQFRAVEGVTSPRVAVLLPSGQRDSSFTSVLDPAEVGQVVAAFDASGRVLIGGDFRSVGGVSRIAVARLLASGALDLSFDAGLTLAFGGPDVRVLRVDANGRVYVGGGVGAAFTALLQPSASSLANGGPRSTCVVRLQSGGTPDATFISPIAPSSQYQQSVTDLYPEADGSVYLAGSAQLFRIDADTRLRREYLVRLLRGGSLDRSVASDLILTDGGAYSDSLTPTDGGRFWLFTTDLFGQGEPPAVTRVFWNGQRDTTWGGSGSVVPTGALTCRTDGRVVFVGQSGGLNSVFLGAADDGGAPVIAAQPVAVRANAGQPAVLRASASGAPGIVFAWFHDGNPVAGGTDGRLALPPVTPTELGQYYAVASNSVGSATTDTVSVTFNTPPTLTLPGAQSVPQLTGVPLDPPISFGDAESVVDLRVWGSPSGVTGNVPLNGLTFAPGIPVSLQAPPLTPVAAPWQYRLVVRAEDQDGASVTSEVVLQVRDSTYAEWSLGYFTPAELADPNISGPNADPNRDGLPNLLAFAFGLDPRVSSAVASPALPKIQPDGLGGFQLTYRAPNLPVGGVGVDLLGSNDLQTWQPVAPNILSRTLLPDQRTVEIQARVPFGSGPFYRVRATEQ
ncbi:MAG: hypothetical protein JSR82_17775 [Verrucomicrobia bacterium]|nr:hypothetical protein [Verrucomicrobiota bacterium]